MYKTIKNPKTGRNININTKLGRQIVRNYLRIFNGGSNSNGPKFKVDDIVKINAPSVPHRNLLIGKVLHVRHNSQDDTYEYQVENDNFLEMIPEQYLILNGPIFKVDDIVKINAPSVPHLNLLIGKVLHVIHISQNDTYEYQVGNDNFLEMIPEQYLILMGGEDRWAEPTDDKRHLDLSHTHPWALLGIPLSASIPIATRAYKRIQFENGSVNSEQQAALTFLKCTIQKPEHVHQMDNFKKCTTPIWTSGEIDNTTYTFKNPFIGKLDSWPMTTLPESKSKPEPEKEKPVPLPPAFESGNIVRITSLKSPDSFLNGASAKIISHEGIKDGSHRYKVFISGINETRYYSEKNLAEETSDNIASSSSDQSFILERLRRPHAGEGVGIDTTFVPGTRPLTQPQPPPQPQSQPPPAPQPQPPPAPQPQPQPQQIPLGVAVEVPDGEPSNTNLFWYRFIFRSYHFHNNCQWTELDLRSTIYLNEMIAAGNMQGQFTDGQLRGWSFNLDYKDPPYKRFQDPLAFFIYGIYEVKVFKERKV